MPLPKSSSPAAAASRLVTSSTTPSPDPSAAEGRTGREASETASGAAAAGHTEASERLLGINTEATPLIVAVDLFAFVLIALVLLLSGTALRRVGLVVAGSGLAAVGLDVREGLHQHDLGQTGLVVLVVIVAVTRIGSAAGGGLLARGRGTGLGR